MPLHSVGLLRAGLIRLSMQLPHRDRQLGMSSIPTPTVRPGRDRPTTPRLLREFIDKPQDKVDGTCLKEIPAPTFQLGSAGPQP